jgi:hypothetical protein
MIKTLSGLVGVPKITGTRFAFERTLAEAIPLSDVALAGQTGA